MVLCVKLRWMLALSCLATYMLDRSSSLSGQFEVCQRQHTFTINQDANTTYLTYGNTGGESVVVTFENLLLPSRTLCGDKYERCNAIIASNVGRTVRVVLFPVDMGVALASFDYSNLDDTFVYREQYILPNSIPDCTFVFFIEDLIGYCLEAKTSYRIIAFRIYVDFSALSSSSIRQSALVTQTLDDITSLSNFVFFHQLIQDNCFDNEGNHVLFINNRHFFDHGLLNERISRHFDERIDSTCSRLHRVGSVCSLAVHCNNSVLLITTRGQGSIFTEAEYGQTFFCPNEDFVSFQNGTLTLHHPSGLQFGNSISFPLGEIDEGYCLHVSGNFFFIATMDNGRTLLVNFTDASYQELGICDFSMAVPPARVKDHFAIVNNGSDTQVYNLGLACMPEPLVIPGNFHLVTTFSTRTMDWCRCLEPFTTISPSGPAVPEMTPVPSSSPTALGMTPVPSSSPTALGMTPVPSSSPTALGMTPVPSSSPTVFGVDYPSTSTTSALSTLVSRSSISSTPTPSIKPMSSVIDSPNVGGIIGGVAGAIVIAAVLVLIILLVLICKCYTRKKRNNSVNLELQTLNKETVAVTNVDEVDPSLVDNLESQRQKKESQEDEPQVIQNLRQSSDSLKTEVQVKDLNSKDPSTDSGSADTSITLREPSQNLSLELRNVVCEEAVEQPNYTDPEGGSDSQQITIEAEVHHDGNEVVSDSPVPPMISAEPDSNEYTQPLADTCGESSQLLVTYDTCIRPDSHGNGPENRNIPTPTVMSNCNGGEESSTLPWPLQNTDNSPACLVVSNPNYSSRFHPENLQEGYRQYDDRANTTEYRQLVAHVVGGGMSNGVEPSNGRCMVGNGEAARQVTVDNEQLTHDPDVLRQISTDSEESRG